MTRGRKPEPDQLQAAKGAPGKRMSQQEAQAIRSKVSNVPVTVGKVAPPKWLKRSRKATEVWNDLAPKLGKLNLLHELDAPALARYCRYVCEWVAADVAVQKEGTWFETTNTNGEATKKRHPAWQACQDLEKLLSGMEDSFGMRPDARYKIMRDQAAAAGLGGMPLFNTKPDQPKEPSPAAEETQEPEDMVGFLQSLNSVPPGQLQ